jgi:small subunit ribosomal protein S11
MSKEETIVEEKQNTEEIAKATVEENDDADETSKEEKRSKKTEDGKAGIAYVFGSFNNTIVHVTDLGGNTISRVTGGMVTKHSRLKANPTTAMFVAKRASERAKDVGITSLYIRYRGQTNAPGIGPGAHAAVKTLGKEGFKILSVIDTTKVPRGGPKKKGGKRGRRV